MVFIRKVVTPNGYRLIGQSNGFPRVLRPWYYHLRNFRAPIHLVSQRGCECIWSANEGQTFNYTISFNSLLKRMVAFWYSVLDALFYRVLYLIWSALGPKKALATSQRGIQYC